MHDRNGHINVYWRLGVVLVIVSYMVHYPVLLVVSNRSNNLIKEIIWLLDFIPHLKFYYTLFSEEYFLLVVSLTGFCVKMYSQISLLGWFTDI